MTGDGAAACGHAVTLAAATEILRAGGNAFDAAAGAAWAACVAEPLLASPGGGGFLLARLDRNDHRLYDFFVHTPRHRRPHDEVAVREIVADFGSARQAFGIGLGAAATPGVVAGIFRFHRELGRMSMSEVAAPAVDAARAGVRVNRMQAYVAAVLAAILESVRDLPAVVTPEGRIVREGDTVHQPGLANLIEALARDGETLFYRGEVAEAVDRASRESGGHLTRDDFEAYRVVRRAPLGVRYRGHRIWTNPPPASGGLMVAFGLRVLESFEPGREACGPSGALRVAAALGAMQEARLREGLGEAVGDRDARRVLRREVASDYLQRVLRHPPARGGTTHVSVLDSDGRAASLTLSNGEGSGWVVPGTGMMLNNMLGEVDLLPRGLGRWPADVRLTSMMAPTVAEERSGRLLVLGSGGANRIRAAILQVLAGVFDRGLTLAEAIAAPRLHVDADRLEIEGGFPPEVVRALADRWPDQGVWPDTNLFFGGVHAVRTGPGGTAAVGDPRRGGEGRIVGAREGEARK